jgi:quinol monooxygenase YgiN
MSVVITVTFPVSAEVVENMVDDHREMMMSIVEDGRRQGCLHHAFAADPDGRWTAIDEWPDEESFQRFFAGQQDIPKLVAAFGAGEPTVAVHRLMDTPDRF